MSEPAPPVGDPRSPRRWALFTWFVEHGVEHLHPDDVAGALALVPAGKVFEVIDDGDGLTLRFGRRTTLRVRSTARLEPVAAPAHAPGDAVVIVASDEPAVVLEIHWHRNEAQPFFVLERAGRRSSRRFWARELRGL